MSKKANTEAYLILHNIRSTHNVGSIFRTADAVGVTKIFLTGFTPAPIDRFGRARSDIAKTALGAEKTISWERHSSATALLIALKKKGVYIIAVERVKGARNYKKLEVHFPVVFVFGNEVRGLSKNICARADAVAEIPMRGKKESLNVSVAVGVVLYNALLV